MQYNTGYLKKEYLLFYLLNNFVWLESERLWPKKKYVVGGIRKI